MAVKAKSSCSVNSSDKGLVLFVAMEKWEPYRHKIKADLTQMHKSSVLKMLPPENATHHTTEMFWCLSSH